ncbi:MAG: gamma-glutamylcyclotransferase [Alphaproteobacteria bacterium]|nr:gamma-glutamylcyclotransferase [Alphaproteobacteria bacterium]
MTAVLPRDTLTRRAPLWVFGYGSLIWRPGFRFVERRPAVLHGWHRSFCIWSTHYRGTPERPGLVLGLDRGGSVKGVAFRVAARDRPATLRYLRARELPTDVYVPRFVFLRLGGRRARALTFVVDKTRPSYTGKLPLAVQARHIRHGQGRTGRNLDYLRNTVAHLEAAGVPDPRLRALLRRVQDFGLKRSSGGMR